MHEASSQNDSDMLEESDEEILPRLSIFKEIAPINSRPDLSYRHA